MSIALICVICIWTLIAFFFMLLQCGARVYFLWTSAANIGQYCLSGFQIAISVSATDVLTDLLILVLPIYWVSGFESYSLISIR